MGQRIAVLGAGPMGLAVAYQLASDGHKPVVFEADDRVGGMAAAFDFSGLAIERYYHFHCISDHAFLTCWTNWAWPDQMRWVETKMGYWYQDRLQAWGNPVALLKFQGLSLVAKFRYGLHAFLSTKRNDWKPLDTVEADRLDQALGRRRGLGSAVAAPVRLQVLRLHQQPFGGLDLEPHSPHRPLALQPVPGKARLPRRRFGNPAARPCGPISSATAAKSA